MAAAREYQQPEYRTSGPQAPAPEWPGEPHTSNDDSFLAAPAELSRVMTPSHLVAGVLDVVGQHDRADALRERVNNMSDARMAATLLPKIAGLIGVAGMGATHLVEIAKLLAQLGILK